MPTAGLVSMEQSALLMMQRVLHAELRDAKRVFALVLGPIRTRMAVDSGPDMVSADQVGEVAVAASVSAVAGQEIRLRDQAEFDRAVTLLREGKPVRADAVATMSVMHPKPGRGNSWPCWGELAPRIRAEPGCLRYSVHPTRNDDDGPMLILMEFISAEAFAANSARVARQVPKIAELLRAPLTPPALFGSDIGTG